MRSVVKARFVRGERGVGKMAAHVDYIRHRAGPDRGGGEGRPIFDASLRENIGSDEVKKCFREVLEDSNQRSPLVAHKLILSPGLNAVDLQDYTREIMDKLGSEKGLDLTWYGVKHENTENNHAHVVVLGLDKNGVEVSFGRRDLDRIRDLGDRYIEREHQLERYLQRETDRVLLSREGKYDYDRQGDLEFQKLVGDVYRRREEIEPARESDDRVDSSSNSGSGIDPVTNKKRKYIEWSQEKAVEKLPEDEKIVANGKTYSRFSSSEDLEKLDEYLKEDYSHYLPKEQYGMLGTWRTTKEKFGDDFYEKQAKYKHDKKYNKGYDKEGYDKDSKAARDIEEHRLLDKELRRSLNISDSRYQKMSRQEYKYVSRGRLTEEHVHYSSIQNIARLELLKEKFPERAQEFDSEIAEVRKYDLQQLKDRGWESFDELVNGKPAERVKGRKRGSEKETQEGREADETKEKGEEQGKDREKEHKDLNRENLEGDDRNVSTSKDIGKESKEGKESRDVGEKSVQELTKETGKELDRSGVEQLEGQTKDKGAGQRDAAANAEARNSMDAHGRVEGIQQDQSRDDKEQDRGDDDSDGRGR
ncbi:MAG: hypothetical protein QG574_5347 [Cyanobacteriota bacterium erpe_2018_sw_21hr_WHONDRS-SW48-000092_B_bin.40]|jgi:hypothetical protein|nr:hypothetical protein [Cyanobacteriota bacterium erpe_2018_sw_21hr_WHONDRS-SW48-000092_B_bin.40]